KEISFSNYLSKCFSNKLPGSGTENCEVDLPLKYWLPREPPSDFNSRYDNITAQLGEVNPWSRLMAWREHIFEAGWNDIMTIVESITGNDREEREDLIERLYTSRLHRRLVVGPSGSGEELRPNPMGETLVDSLLHGSRRWLIVPYSELLRVSESAKEALEPTTAFMFFEEKLVELREEFGLQAYHECQQQPGDVIVVPKGVTHDPSTAPNCL
ncbi:jumonji domain-containing protein 6, partial [Perkinsus olseni]